MEVLPVQPPALVPAAFNKESFSVPIKVPPAPLKKKQAGKVFDSEIAIKIESSSDEDSENEKTRHSDDHESLESEGSSTVISTEASDDEKKPKLTDPVDNPKIKKLSREPQSLKKRTLSRDDIPPLLHYPKIVAATAPQDLLGIYIESSRADVVVYYGNEDEGDELFYLAADENIIIFSEEHSYKKIPDLMKIIAEAARACRQLRDPRSIHIKLRHDVTLQIPLASNNNFVITLEYFASKELTEKKMKQTFQKPVEAIFSKMLGGEKIPVTLKPIAETLPTSEQINSTGKTPRIIRGKTPRTTPRVTPRSRGTTPRSDFLFVTGDNSDDEVEVTFTPRSDAETPRDLLKTSRSPKSSPRLFSPRPQTCRVKQRAIVIPALSIYKLKALNDPETLAEIKLEYAIFKNECLEERRGNAYNPRDPQKTISKKFMIDLEIYLKENIPNFLKRLFSMFSKDAQRHKSLSHYLETTQQEWLNYMITETYKPDRPKIKKLRDKKEAVGIDTIQTQIETFSQQERKLYNSFIAALPKLNLFHATDRIAIAKHNLAVTYLETSSPRFLH
jgi:hypothetical protein